jgi:MYXO-CTERM domain-containing protein
MSQPAGAASGRFSRVSFAGSMFVIALVTTAMLLASWPSDPARVRVLSLALSLLVLVGAGVLRRREHHARIEQARTSVELDENDVRFTERGELITIPWQSVTGVDVITTSGGPWAEDVFLVLLVAPDDRVACIVPQESEGFKALANRVLALPHFDVDEFVAAMGCTSDHRFRCWRRPATDAA